MLFREKYPVEWLMHQVEFLQWLMELSNWFVTPLISRNSQIGLPNKIITKRAGLEGSEPPPPPPPQKNKKQKKKQQKNPNNNKHANNTNIAMFW